MTKAAEKSFALTELYEAWPILSAQERADGFMLLQQDDAENFFLHLNARDKTQLILVLPIRERRLWMRLLTPDETLGVIQRNPRRRTGGSFIVAR